MKLKIINITLCILSININYAQVGLGTTSPHASAALDITSTNKGLLPPRMTNVQKNAIVAPPAAGLIVWCTDCGPSGELQVFNGITWTNSNGDTASTSLPSAPTIIEVVAYNAQASVSFTSVSNPVNPITSYTVTASPGGLTATGTSSPIVFTNLNGGTTYSFSVIATNSSGNSPTSASASLKTNCGAYVAEGTWKQFKCHNIGAIESFDPNVPVQDIHGNYYQWGSSTVVADASTPSPTISGWNTSNAVGNAWSDNEKTSNDPCPSGYRIPTYTQLDFIHNTTSTVNVVTITGTWILSESNFGSAIHFGTSSGVKSLTLPLCGYRGGAGGLQARGSQGFYWSSTFFPAEVEDRWGRLQIKNAGNNIFTAIYKADSTSFGFSIRCISE